MSRDPLSTKPRASRVVKANALLLLVAGVGVAGCQAAGGRVISSEQPPVAQTQTLTATDPQFDGMPAVRITTPLGWTMEPRAVQRLDSAFFAVPVVLDFRVVAPDGRSVRFYPALSFEYNRGSHSSDAPPWTPSPRGAIVHDPPASYGDWITQLARTHPAPGVAEPGLISDTELPAARGALESLYADAFTLYGRANAASRQEFGQTRLRAEARHIVLTYTRHGRPEREDFVVLVLRSDYLNPQGVAESGTWSLLAMQSKSGPAERGDALLDDEQLAEVLASWSVDETWARQIDRINQIIEREQTRYQPMNRPELEATPEGAELYASRRRAETQSIARIVADAWAEAAALGPPNP